MQPIRIDDPDDPRVAAYRDVREHDLAGRQGRFVAEGKVVLNVLFSARQFGSRVSENRFAGMTEIFRRAPEGLPVYVATSAVMDALTGFHIHRGILAIGRKRQPQPADEMLAMLPERVLVVALAGIANHDNMGAIFRNAAAFGASAVLLDDTCCDPLYRKATRVSVGATLKVPFAGGGSAQELAATLEAHRFDPIALSPAGAIDIKDVERSQRMALYLGAEGDGLPGDLLKRLKTVRISMAEGFDSLNVAAASAIALHQLRDG